MLISEWYRAGQRFIEITSGSSVWYHSGKEAIAIRSVLIRDLQAKFETQALLCTNLESLAEEIINWFIKYSVF